ncbi:MAG: TIGR02302 family protein [Alphaproteobacteria bacterium]|nr:TIGR02302 family protein [Alphaproteobacteria bacterium]MCW5743642.1 TIGR02302 family protein [Alphaproteobacteria bacterium]
MPVLPPPSIAPASLDRRIAIARAALAWEALWPRLIAPLCFVALFLAAAHLDVFRGLEAWTHTALLAACAAGLIALTWFAFRGLRWPDRAAAERRLEIDSGVPHRPIQAIEDSIAIGEADPFAKAMWEAHRRREAARLAALRNTPPRSDVPRRDPRALRLVPLLGLIVAMVAAGGWRSDRMESAFSPAFPPPPPLIVELWISPPAYTRKAPIYLDTQDAQRVLRVPAGSKVAGFIDNVAEGREAVLRIGSKETPFESVGPGRHQVDADVEGGDTLTVLVSGRERATWKIRLVPDTPPTVEFTRDPQTTERREFRIDYVAGDDYGVTSLKARMRLHGSERIGLLADEEPDWVTLDLPMVASNPARVDDSIRQDLTPHPWAGLKVVIQLEAKDGAEQAGVSKPAIVHLPERRFTHPVARAIIDLRKNLSRDNSARSRTLASRGLLLLGNAPKAFKEDTVVILGLRVAANRLRNDKTGGDVAEAQRLMWDLAVRIEENTSTDAEREFRAAQRELRDALERQAPDPEIERLIRQLQEAMDRMMREFEERMKDPAEREKAEREAQEMDQDQMVDSQDMQDLMDRAREMARNGQREEAKRMLEEMLRQMENMRPMLSDKGQQRRQQGQQQQGQGQQGRNDLNQLDRMAREQNRQLGETERQNRGQQQGQQGQRGQQRQPGQRDPGQGQPGQQGQPSPGEMGRQQGDLRRQLGDFMQRFADRGGDMPQSLGQSERSMRDAEEALRRGDLGDAARAQRRALEQLQQGMGDLAEQMQAGPGNQQDRGRIEDRNEARDRDPLGRSEGNYGGAVDTDHDKIPDRLDRQRARDILEELRRRAGETQRPKEELDYIDRLLRQF